MLFTWPGISYEAYKNTRIFLYHKNYCILWTIYQIYKPFFSLENSHSYAAFENRTTSVQFQQVQGRHICKTKWGFWNWLVVSTQIFLFLTTPIFFGSQIFLDVSFYINVFWTLTFFGTNFFLAPKFLILHFVIMINMIYLLQQFSFWEHSCIFFIHSVKKYYTQDHECYTQDQEFYSIISGRLYTGSEMLYTRLGTLTTLLIRLNVREREMVRNLL